MYQSHDRQAVLDIGVVDRMASRQDLSLIHIWNTAPVARANRFTTLVMVTRPTFWLKEDVYKRQDDALFREGYGFLRRSGQHAGHALYFRPSLIDRPGISHLAAYRQRYGNFCHDNTVSLPEKLPGHAGGQIPGSLNPVSYTHLDVYKRQASWVLPTTRRELTANCPKTVW